MSKCKHCGVDIRDVTTVCPLCDCVLEPDDTQQNTYPEIWLRERRMNTVSRFFLLTMLAVSTLLIWLNTSFYPQYPWCIYPVAGLVYAYLILRCGFAATLGYRAKISILLLCGLGLLILVDQVAGAYGWSINYVVPSAILLADGVIALLMLINMRNWQSYIMFQIGVLCASLLPLILWYFGIVTHPLLSFIALAITAFFLLGSLLIGFRRAVVELKRRFHF